MLAYGFAVRDGATEIEKLGSMTLANDDAALAFGRRMIRDLMREGAEQYAGWTMDVAKGERAVASIPFDSGPDQG